MKTKMMILAALLASAAGGSATALTIPAAPFFAEVMEYMDEQGVGDACMEMRVRAGKPSEIEVTRSSGDARFDALATKGLRLEIDVLERFPLDWRKADAAGWRNFPLRFSGRDGNHSRVLGCRAGATNG